MTCLLARMALISPIRSPPPLPPDEDCGFGAGAAEPPSSLTQKNAHHCV